MIYGLKLMFFAAVTIVLALTTITIGLFERHGKVAYRVNRFWTWIILWAGGVSLKVRGLEHIDPRQPYIFMVNHQSNVDIPVLVQSLPQFQLRWVAKKELLKVPFFGWAMWATKHVTVDRNDPQGAVRSLKVAQERMAAGISIVVFPEGTRSRDGKLQRFKKGGFLLAAQAGKPIVPVTINGSGRLLPSGAFQLRPGTIEVTVDKPVSVVGFRAGNLRLLSNQVRDTIQSHLNGRDANTTANRREQGDLAAMPLEKPTT
ncbi:MAG: 1-acyl-sn-glycerol-3-phosphate acyltransferase [Deltaproteobacteria bacterium]|nr:1-acyl-sn-glycerol-3-phosphate acyltransferase [Deltaproteobacteria bacterium]